ncbi:MAG: CRISPR-associated endonuclease Cas1 [Deltaproteobacteria bacterium]|nr:MAG: CRISPR-associated endonuclease Cas1 [Deltaproteobacteria bacterium]
MAAEKIYPRLATMPALFDAWRKIEKKGSRGGIDGVSVDAYRENLEKNLKKLLASLLDGSYLPQASAGITVKKPGKPGEYRHLALPTINDKVVQLALKELLEPIFNRLFLDVSYAYRPGKGPARAIRRISHILLNQKCHQVVCMDIDNFFDTMDHELLITEFSKTVDEDEITALLRLWLKIGVLTSRNRYHEGRSGTAQGSIISPLLSNIYLHPFDAFMAARECRYLRYADNIFIGTRSREQAAAEFAAARDFLATFLHLAINEQQYYLYDSGKGFSFMGIFFRGEKRLISRDRTTRLEKSLGELTRKLFPDKVEQYRQSLGEKIDGFDRYYGQLIDMEKFSRQADDFLAESIVRALFSNSSQRRKKYSRRALDALLAGLPHFSRDKSPDGDRKWENRLKETYLSRLAANDYLDQHRTSTIRSTDRKIRKRQRQYRKLESLGREVIVQEYGTFLGKSGGKLVIKKKGKKLFEFPLGSLETINVVTRGVVVSSDLVYFCADRGVPLFFSDYTGMPRAALLRPKNGDPGLGLRQLQILANGRQTLELAREFVRGKIRNQINLLKYYRRSRKENREYLEGLNRELPGFDQCLDRIEALETGEDGFEATRSRLMGFEAESATRYWRMVRILLRDDIAEFPGRIRKGATDLVNSLLNYGYGFLYRQVWRQAVQAGLNPRISFLHSPQGNKPTLIYDLVEEFRSQAVDRVIFSMITKNEKLSLDKQHGRLDDPTRQKLLENLLERQAGQILYGGSRTSFRNIIRNQVRRLCRHLKGGKPYRHFTAYY